MAETAQATGAAASETVLSIDAMGGDLGPSVVVDGMAKAAGQIGGNGKFLGLRRRPQRVVPLLRRQCAQRRPVRSGEQGA